MRMFRLEELKVWVERKVEIPRCRAVRNLKIVDEMDYRLALPLSIEGFYKYLMLFSWGELCQTQATSWTARSWGSIWTTFCDQWVKSLDWRVKWLRMRSLPWFWSRGHIDVPRRSIVKWLVDTGKLPGNVRVIRNGFERESKIVVLKQSSDLLSFGTKLS